MGRTSPGEILAAVPRLRDHLTRSRERAERAIERARQLGQDAELTRRLLERHKGSREQGPLQLSIWRAAATELARLSREHDRELAVVAHELRQPLSAALAAERLLALAKDPGTSEHARAVLRRQLLHLAQLVDKLLSYSRLSAISIAVSSTPFDLRNLATAAVETVEGFASDQGVALHLNAGNEPVPVEGDAMQLRQALVNVLQNAVRYTPRGGRVDIELTIGDDIELRVRDTGEGISTDRLEAIFEPFVRVSDTGPGLGIGLALVKRVVELHGGSVRAESDGPGTGALVAVVLPKAKGHAPPAT